MDFLCWFDQKARFNAVVVGDFNINWNENSTSRKRLLAWSSDNDMKQLVKDPTHFRVDKEGVVQSSSTIDLCFTRGQLNFSHHLIDPKISDHAAVIVRAGRVNSKPAKVSFQSWSFSADALSFAASTSHKLLSITASNSTSVDDLARVLTDWLIDVNNVCIVTKTKTDNPRNKPWFTQTLRDLRLKLKRANGPEARKLRNQYVSAVRRAKSKHFRKLANMHSQAGIWKVINRRNSAVSPPLQLDIDGTNISNEQEVCEAFGEHFREKVNRLKKNSNASEIFKKLRDAYPSVPSWDLSHCTEEQVEKYIKNLKNTMSTGPDQISNRLLKATSDFILSPLTKIINLSIDSGIFPKIWKETKISPIHKSGSKTSIKNYRPIALTSTLGKVLEGMIHKQYHPQLSPSH